VPHKDVGDAEDDIAGASAPMSSAAKRRRRRKLKQQGAAVVQPAIEAAQTRVDDTRVEHTANAFEDDVESHHSMILYGATVAAVRDYEQFPLLEHRYPVPGDHLAWERLVLTSRFEPASIVEEGVVLSCDNGCVELALDAAFLPELDPSDPLFTCETADEIDLLQRERERSHVRLPVSHPFRLLEASSSSVVAVSATRPQQQQQPSTSSSSPPPPQQQQPAQAQSATGASKNPTSSTKTRQPWHMSVALSAQRLRSAQQ
jgi:hypothetical protein